MEKEVTKIGRGMIIDCKSIFIIDDVVLADKIKDVIKEHEDKIKPLGEDTPIKPPKPKDE